VCWSTKKLLVAGCVYSTRDKNDKAPRLKVSTLVVLVCLSSWVYLICIPSSICSASQHPIGHRSCSEFERATTVVVVYYGLSFVAPYIR